MTISDIERLQNLYQDAERTDLFHFLRKDEWGLLLSYKAKITSLSTVFEDVTKLRDLEDRIKAVEDSFDALSAKFITKTETDRTYVSKETLNNTIPALLTYSQMEELTAKYVTEDKVKEKAAAARQEAHKLADEMTDFVGAAMVGINQSGGAAAAPAEGGSTPSAHETYEHDPLMQP